MVGGELVVGFDLDMTLIDTTVGFAATLQALGAELGVEFPVAELTQRLGPPLDRLLEGHLGAEQIAPAVERFRELYPEHAVVPVQAFPGAHAALAAVRRQHGRTVLVTGKHTPNAQLHVDHLGLDLDLVAGQVWGTGKAEVLREERASIYVGDHVYDVQGALAAGATSVSVLTGGCDREELLSAGTHVVLDDLQAFPAWLDEHLLGTRLQALEAQLSELGRVLVAFSGGADSAFLLDTAVRVLGPHSVAAGTAYSPALPLAERQPALDFAAARGIRTLTPVTDELAREGYRANAGDRCAFCKSELMEVLGPLALAEGYDHVLTGTNADDVRAGFRPGIAAAADRGAVSPLRDAGLTKEQIRQASRDRGLPTWDKPAAACLSSRIAYGIEITPARLARVERAEAELRLALTARGFQVRDLRVRDLGQIGRVEIDAALVGVAEEFLDVVRREGFAHAEVDPRGFRSGSMNELLSDPQRYR